MKTNSLFYFAIPKDLTYYQDFGISPGSAITSSDIKPLLNTQLDVTAGTASPEKVMVDGWLMETEMITNPSDDTETVAGVAPTPLGTYPFHAGCTTNCKKFFIIIGDAFNVD